jgi:hypothetical protein
MQKQSRHACQYNKQYFWCTAWCTAFGGQGTTNKSLGSTAAEHLLTSSGSAMGLTFCHQPQALPWDSRSAIGLMFCHQPQALPLGSCSAIRQLMFCHQAAHVLPSGSSCSAIRQLMFCHQAAHVLPSGGSCSATFSLVGVMYCTNTTFSGFSIQVLNYYFLLFFILFYSKIHFGSEKKFNNFMKFFLGQ